MAEQMLRYDESSVYKKISESDEEYEERMRVLDERIESNLTPEDRKLIEATLNGTYRAPLETEDV